VPASNRGGFLIREQAQIPWAPCKACFYAIPCFFLRYTRVTTVFSQGYLGSFYKKPVYFQYKISMLFVFSVSFSSTTGLILFFHVLHFCRFLPAGKFSGYNFKNFKNAGFREFALF